ncbi:MAG: hypothetical protein ACE5I9_10980 [Candidatus Methylomirabilales bacterium]
MAGQYNLEEKEMDMSQAKWERIAILASALALAGLFLGTSVVRAGENKGKISLSAGVDFPTAYFFRGILQEDEDFIAQPYLETTINLYEASEALNSVSATLGIWNSFHAGPTGGSGTNNDPRIWYEADLYGGLTFGLFEDWEAGVTYTAYTSPNGAFTTVQEIAFSLSFDDSDLLGAFALSPTVLVAIEIDEQADGGTDEGVYLELGIEPGFTVIESKDYPVSLAFPVTLGLSLDDYYQDSSGDDDTFGYLDAGIVASMPLGFIPADYGSVKVFAGVHFLVLGDNLEAVNTGDDFEAIGTFGISLAY